jgi:N-methylhydantoinase B
MQFTTQAVIERRPDLQQGDVILVNDPYLGGTHLMDVKMVRPFYYRGHLWCYLSNTGHWPDTGGMVPGGFSATATEIVQEGLRLPPVKLVRRGEICQDIVDIVLNNIRVADERIGDIRAQLGALSVGERRLTQLLDRYGVDTVDAAIAELKAGSERLMRAHIDSIPDGTYSATAIVDSDGIVDRPLEVVLDMTVSDSGIHFDLSRSSPPYRGPMNSVWATTQSAVYVAMKHIFPTCRSMLVVSRQSTLLRPRTHFSMPAIRARSPAAPPRWRSASWRRYSGRWERRSRSVSSRRRPVPAAISGSAATTPKKTGITSCTCLAAAGTAGGGRRTG